MSDETSNENWLHSEMIVCPHCHHQLYRVDRSPMCDEWLLYCNQCAGRVEVSYYNPEVQAFRDEIGKETGSSAREAYIALRRAIEVRLKPCSCGGQYQFNAPRRCHICQDVVIADDSGVDLWPEIAGIENDPTPEEAALYEQFDAEYVRHDANEGIWK
jgi:hypothetical protein